MGGSEMEQEPERTEAGAERLEQLTGLLGTLVAEHGNSGAATVLGVSDRTIRRSLTAGELSRGLRIALEKHLLLREGAALPDSPWERRLEALERQQMELTQQLSSQAGELGETRAAMTEHVQEASGRHAELERALAEALEAQRDLQQRLDRVEERSQERPESPPVRDSAMQAGGSGGGAPGHDGAVRDEKAEALVNDWRNAKDVEAQARTRLERVTAAGRRVTAAGRRLALEIELIREHGVSIPPEERWSEAIRSQELSWRRDALGDRRRERRQLQVRRWVRRVLSLGLWRR